MPELIIVDIMMPVMNGRELCQQLKGDVVTSHIPVIMLTAQCSQQNELDGLAVGADDYVTKPFVMLLLEARIRNQITSRQKLRERFSANTTISPSKVTVTPAAEVFLEQAVQIVEDNIADYEFTVTEFGKAIGMSERTLQKNLKLSQVALLLFLSAKFDSTAQNNYSSRASIPFRK